MDNDGYRFCGEVEMLYLLSKNAYTAYSSSDCMVYARDCFGLTEYALKWYGDDAFFDYGLTADAMNDYFEDMFDECFAEDCD